MSAGVAAEDHIRNQKVVHLASGMSSLACTTLSLVSTIDDIMGSYQESEDSNEHSLNKSAKNSHEICWRSRHQAHLKLHVLLISGYRKRHLSAAQDFAA